jgi:L-threonylcarbamoyladenylate synthase
VKTQTLAAIYNRRQRSQTAATERAAELLRKGEIVALPTETVYGLAASALDPIAVTKIFEAKGRPRFDPLIVHLPDRKWLQRVVKIDNHSHDLIEQLITQFWPGPFTMVLPKQKLVPDIVTAGLDTVAVRISAHPVFAEVIRRFGKPLAAPSANRFGRVSPTTAQHVLDELEGRIPLIVDSGPTEHGIESTIVALRDGKIDILRRGPVTAEQLADFTKTAFISSGDKISAPGQLLSHYAPKTPLQLIDDAKTFVPDKNQRVALLAWNPESKTFGFPAADLHKRRSAASAQLRPAKGDRRSLKFVAVRRLSEKQDLRESAANLFRYLRELDELDADLIVAERVPRGGLGAAIMDRLHRASHRPDRPGKPG